MATTIADCRRMTEDVKTAELVASYLFAKASAEYMRERVDAYLQPVFKRYEFWCAHTGERIENYRQIYRALDTQEEQCDAFFRACDAEHRRQGYEPEQFGQCPALVAEHQAIEQRKKLLDHARKMLDMPEIYSPDLLDQLEELVVGAVMNGPNGETVKSALKNAVR